MHPKVVIIGGGYGGAAAARALDAETDVTLIEPKDAFLHSVATLRAAVRADWASRIFIPYDKLLHRGRIVRDRAVRVEAMQVSLRSGRQIDADYIVLATGSTYPFPAKTDLDDRDSAERKFRATSRELASVDRVLVLGAGPVGLELAGEILAEWPKKHVVIVDPRADILGEYSDELRSEIHGQLRGFGAQLILGSALAAEPSTAPGVAGRFTVRTRTGVEITADLWFRCYGARAVTDYLAGDLAVARQPDGSIRVTADLRVEGQQAIFALGDITSIPESKKAKAAGLHAEVIAANIKALAAGSRHLSVYTPGPTSIVLPLGPNGGATQAPGIGVVGAEQTSRFKGADLNVDRFRTLLGYPAEAADECPVQKRKGQ